MTAYENRRNRYADRPKVSFLHKGEICEVELDPHYPMLLDFLRDEKKLTGTKEGCAEGDCGACTVVVGELADDDSIRYKAINACILPIAALDGKQLITVEDLASDQEELHPVQSAMVESHASQCGFCTPGFVMSLFANYQNCAGRTNKQQIQDCIAGNLCRCTGYRPIVDAGLAACSSAANDKFKQNQKYTVELLKQLEDSARFGSDEITNEDQFFVSPRSIDELAKVCAQYPDATLIAGATDVGLWITKQLRELGRVIYLGQVEGLDQISETSEEVEIGATCTYSKAHATLAKLDPDIGELVRRIGSVQIRNSGTIGGNITNGSPIGDMPPALIALGSHITLQKADSQRKILLENFFIDYGKQDLEAGEFLKSIHVPKLKENEHFRCFKISKRFDQDITAVLGAMYFCIDNNRIKSCRLAFGGVAAVPKRASKIEAKLTGIFLSEKDEWSSAIDSIYQDFSPISDMRASEEYRLKVAKSLLLKALLEITQQATDNRLVGKRELADA